MNVAFTADSETMQGLGRRENEVQARDRALRKKRALYSLKTDSKAQVMQTRMRSSKVMKLPAKLRRMGWQRTHAETRAEVWNELV